MLGMVPRHNHERNQIHLLQPLICLHLPQRLFQSRVALHGRHIEPVSSHILKSVVQSGVYRIGIVLRAVPHQQHGLFLAQIGKLRRQDFRHPLQIPVGSQKRRADAQVLKPAPVCLSLPEHLVVFYPVEQVRRLNQHIGDPVPEHPLQRIRHGICFNSLPPQLLNDHSAGPGPVNLAVRKGLSQIGLNLIDGFLSGVVVRRAKAHHQKRFILFQCRFPFWASDPNDSSASRHAKISGGLCRRRSESQFYVPWFWQKRSPVPMYLTYPHRGLHSDRLAGLCTLFHAPFPAGTGYMDFLI